MQEFQIAGGAMQTNKKNKTKVKVISYQLKSNLEYYVYAELITGWAEDWPERDPKWHPGFQTRSPQPADTTDLRSPLGWDPHAHAETTLIVSVSKFLKVCALFWKKKKIVFCSTSRNDSKGSRSNSSSNATHALHINCTQSRFVGRYLQKKNFLKNVMSTI